jgi:hypothetical protein
MTEEEMIEKFQCPGCVSGPDPKTCPHFKLSTEYGFKCGGHVLGTSINMQIHIALGMPKGFNRTPPQDDKMRTRSTMELGMWLEGTKPDWDKLNVPVWALEQDDCLFVRTFSPRTDRSRIDVIAGGKLDMVPGALDVSKFYEEFD